MLEGDAEESDFSGVVCFGFFEEPFFVDAFEGEASDAVEFGVVVLGEGFGAEGGAFLFDIFEGFLDHGVPVFSDFAFAGESEHEIDVAAPAGQGFAYVVLYHAYLLT